MKRSASVPNKHRGTVSVMKQSNVTAATLARLKHVNTTIILARDLLELEQVPVHKHLHTQPCAGIYKCIHLHQISDRKTDLISRSITDANYYIAAPGV